MNEVVIARSTTVLAVLGVIATMYFAKAVFLPLALAILLTFLLAPAVRLLRSWGLPKPPAVVLVVAFAFTVILGIGALVGQQVTKLAQNLPVYQYNIEEKIRSARGFAGGAMLERISNFLGDLNEEVLKKNDTPPRGAVPQRNEEPAKPIPVEVHQPDATPVQVVRRVLEPLVDPLTTAGLVVIFVIFFLSQRQDLRDRLIRLAGSRDLQRTPMPSAVCARKSSRDAGRGGSPLSQAVGTYRSNPLVVERLEHRGREGLDKLKGGGLIDGAGPRIPAADPVSSCGLAHVAGAVGGPP
jgi:predicted PurR-regulated permease PerM